MRSIIADAGVTVNGRDDTWNNLLHMQIIVTEDCEVLMLVLFSSWRRKILFNFDCERKRSILGEEKDHEMTLSMNKLQVHVFFKWISFDLEDEIFCSRKRERERDMKRTLIQLKRWMFDCDSGHRERRREWEKQMTRRKRGNKITIWRVNLQVWWESEEKKKWI